ncbi:MAG: SDR family NAD(P)-dependent oxidoreductase [Gemmatimonadaceae bacterium]
MRNEKPYLSEEHAVVTGGGRGIGAAIADELARLGASVTLMGRNMEALETHAAYIARTHETPVAAVRCDVSEAISIELAFAEARAKFGDPYVLVNNAGLGMAARVGKTSLEMWQRTLAVNLTGPFLCIQHVLPAMIELRGGRIINIASTAGLAGYSKLAAYTASKHGLVGLTRALALEVAKLGITVNAVCPGYTETDMAQSAVDNMVTALKKTPSEAREIIVSQIPRGVITQPSEVASLVGWLCAPDARAVTGQAIAVDGAELA